MCVGIKKGRPAPSQGNDVSLTKGAREKTKRCEEIYGLKLHRGRGGVGDSNFLCLEYDTKADQVANETDSREWDHSCNIRNVAADGKYLEEVNTFDTGGIQGRHIPEYFEQRRPNVGMRPNYFLWGGV